MLKKSFRNKNEIHIYLFSLLLFLLFITIIVFNKNTITEGMKPIATIASNYCSEMNQNDCTNKWKTQPTYSSYMNPCAWNNNSCSNNAEATQYYVFS